VTGRKRKNPRGEKRVLQTKGSYAKKTYEKPLHCPTKKETEKGYLENRDMNCARSEVDPLKGKSLFPGKKKVRRKTAAGRKK